ncbi:hypothetical protein [Mongoliimonas terrestris]|uniref:hypothetical protein n=1 Tax=Mongoliimonas terrestris TaxID=1709001 RepID=UPI0015881E4C|nr:hypothetical protein [Mongoliimonas terrestris]
MSDHPGTVAREQIANKRQDLSASGWIKTRMPSGDSPKPMSASAVRRQSFSEPMPPGNASEDERQQADDDQKADDEDDADRAADELEHGVLPGRSKLRKPRP